jgi:hypothetical protein
MLLAFTGSRIEINDLLLAYALVLGMGLVLVICRALIRMRKFAICGVEDNSQSYQN